MDDERKTLSLPVGGSRCRHGHQSDPAPDVDRELGMVPARSSCWLGAGVLLVVVSVLVWLLPAGARPWIALVLGAWLLAVFLIQLALGHRGRCLVRRSARWFLGPIGALIDPFDS